MQRTDSTQVLAAVRSLGRLDLVQETLSLALAALLAADPVWTRSHAPADWEARYGVRVTDRRLPQAPAARQVLGQTIGTAGAALLTAVYAVDAPAALRLLPAVQVARQVWLQQFLWQEGQLRWREQRDLPPAALQVVSPVDSQARWSMKRRRPWTGYKVHLTETCDDDLPHLVTAVQTTLATVPDVLVTAQVQQTLAQRELLPTIHLVDAGYVDADGLVASAAQGVSLLGPMEPDASWQARTPGCYGAERFVLDWERQVATCPQGQQSRHWRPGVNEDGRTVIVVQFGTQACRACAARARCTSKASHARSLKIRPQAEQEALVAARHRRQEAGFWAVYGRREGIEGTISQAMVAVGGRRSRYRGMAKTHLGQVMGATGITLQRLSAWVTGTPRHGTLETRWGMVCHRTAA